VCALVPAVATPPPPFPLPPHPPPHPIATRGTAYSTFMYPCACTLVPPNPTSAEGFAWQGTQVDSLFGWAHDIPALLVSIAVAVGLCFLGVSTFAINSIDRRPHGSVAVLALIAEPFLAAGFARGGWRRCVQGTRVVGVAWQSSILHAPTDQ
jgi:hypothetical protein